MTRLEGLTSHLTNVVVPTLLNPVTDGMYHDE